MNQDNTNFNNYNTQGNNRIPNNQPLNNQNMNQDMGVDQQQVQSQQPIHQSINNFESTNLNNQSNNIKAHKKINFGLIIGIVAAVVVIFVTMLLLFNKSKNTQLDNHSKPNLLDLKTYTNSKSDDNIAIPFNATTNGYYVINIKENNIGGKLVLTEEKLKNDSIIISHYYRTNYTDGNIEIDNLWNFELININTGYSKLPTTTDLVNYDIIQNDDNFYLVHSKWKNSGSESYDIYIGNYEKDYFFKVTSSDLNSLDKAKELYKKFKMHTEVCYINFDEKDNFLVATKSIKNTTSVDVSTWRFLPDMIIEYFINHGLIYRSSVQTEGFNHNSTSEIMTYQMYELDNKPYIAGFIIREISKKKYENVVIEENRKASHITSTYEGIKKIKLLAFDETYLYSSLNYANIFVKAGDYYYIIDTGLIYNNGSNTEELTNTVTNVMNQVFK